MPLSCRFDISIPVKEAEIANDLKPQLSAFVLWCLRQPKLIAAFKREKKKENSKR